MKRAKGSPIVEQLIAGYRAMWEFTRTQEERDKLLGEVEADKIALQHFWFDLEDGNEAQDYL